jgi:sterol desaturase/sphingolipid hydroxylase (fatty acid hydroxylase superfamily)
MMLAAALNDLAGWPTWVGLPVIAAFLIGARYAVFAGGALLLLIAFAGPLKARRIRNVPFTRAQFLREAGYSALSIGVFAAVICAAFALEARFDIFRIYADIDALGLAWLVASVPVAILIHDFYFYWTHRFMHLPGVYERVHRVHHLSANPSPLSAFAFHPAEALIEAMAVVVIAMLIPMHPSALVAVGLYSIATNVMGHAGYELLPRGLAGSRLFGWINTATSHNQHHRTYAYNFGLYTLVWDRLFGTLHPKYPELYARVTAPSDSAQALSAKETR